MPVTSAIIDLRPDTLESLPKAERDSLVDDLARSEFANRYGEPSFGDITVVIPAYQEEENIRAVIEGIPGSALGRKVSVLVVTDGCKDLTADVARSAGAFVCEAPANRGQGAAFRLGYGVALDHGSKFIVTVDADGQYYPSDMETLLARVVSGEADLAQGSRRLGTAEKDDRFRTAGVYFFGALISLLIGQKITDSSNGFRAMRAELPQQIVLSEDQYQSSEFLIGTAMRGFKVVECPVGMRKRSSGKSKKAPNLFYGLQYLRVILKTWWRER